METINLPNEELKGAIDKLTTPQIFHELNRLDIEFKTNPPKPNDTIKDRYKYLEDELLARTTAGILNSNKNIFPRLFNICSPHET